MTGFFYLSTMLVGLAFANADQAPGVDVPTRSQVCAAVLTASPGALPDGVSVGAIVEGRRQWGPWFVSLRLGWSQLAAANVAWVIEHQQVVVALGGGVEKIIGAGRIWAQAGAGATGIYETLMHHQNQRIDAAGVPGGTLTSFTVGPLAFAEVGLTLKLRGSVGALLAAGPALSRIQIDTGAAWRLGAMARMGLTLAF